MRVRALLALAVLGVVPTAGAAEVPPIGIIDLVGQPEAAASVREALAAAKLPLATDGLYGGVVTAASRDELTARDELAHAETAYAARKCDVALPALDRALDLLLGVREAAARAPRLAARALALVCADQLGDAARAHREARALAALGAGRPPAGVPDSVWGRWADPEIDVLLGGDVEPRGQLRIESTELDTVVLLDGREAGTAPVEVEVGGGPHVIVGLAPGHDPARLTLDLGAKPPRTETALVKPHASPEVAARDAVRAQLEATGGKFELASATAIAGKVRYARAIVLAADGARLLALPEGLAGPRRELPAALGDLLEDARRAVAVPAANPTLGAAPPIGGPIAASKPVKKHPSKVWPWVAAGTVAAVALTIILVRPGSGGSDTLTIHTQYP